MKNKTPLAVVPPQLPASAQLTVLTEFEFDNDEDYVNIILNDLDLTQNEARESRVDGSQFTRVAFIGVELNKCHLRDSRFENCNMSNAAWRAGKLTQLHFVNCKFTGFKLIDTQLTNVRFEKCAGKFMQLNSSVCKKVIFEDCSLAGADFSNCNLQEAAFIRCDLSEALFYDAKLEGTDFRSSALTGIKANVKDLAGAIIDERQSMELAPLFADMLGIVVKKD